MRAFALFDLFLIFCCLSSCSYQSPEVRIKNIFPVAKQLTQLNPKQSIYFERINYDIEKERIALSIDSIRNEAEMYYDDVMKTVDTADSTEPFVQEKMEFLKYDKRKVIDSIISSSLIDKKLSNLLFSKFANKPYFTEKFKNPICNPDSLSIVNWNLMQAKLSVFNDSAILKNFDNISKQIDSEVISVAVGILLIQNGTQFNWMLLYGWELKEDLKYIAEKQNKKQKHNCYLLGHVLGEVYNFDFSKKLNSFQCM